MAKAPDSLAILGGKGMLGSDLSLAARRQGLEPIVLDLPQFDITNAEHLERAVTCADVIVNCAAYTNVDGSSDQRRSGGASRCPRSKD